jgi:hypothetical protein
MLEEEEVADLAALALTDELALELERLGVREDTEASDLESGR